MKKRLCFIMLLFCVNVPMNAQKPQKTHRSFFETEVWIVSDGLDRAARSYSVNKEIQQEISGKRYYGMEQTSLAGHSESETVAYIREEGKRVYCVYAGETEEFLLYDFGLGKGETAEVGYGESRQTVTIANVDTVFLDNMWLRRLQIETEGCGDDIRPAYWIEGVGSVMGPLFPCGWGRNGFCHQLDCCGTKDNIASIRYADFFVQTSSFTFLGGSPYWLFVQNCRENRDFRYIWFYIPDESSASIGGKEYKQMFYGFKSYIDGSHAEEKNTTYLMGIREAGGRVYVNLKEYQEAMRQTGLGDAENIPYPVTDDGEMVLYDFNAQEGDRFCPVAGHDDLFVKKITPDPYYGRKTFTVSNGVIFTEGYGASSAYGTQSAAGLIVAYLNALPYSYESSYLKMYGRGSVYMEYGEDGSGVIVDKPEITLGVKNVSCPTVLSSSVYDLQGRRVCQGNNVTEYQGNKLPKGIYIQNGRKVVVK